MCSKIPERSVGSDRIIFNGEGEGDAPLAKVVLLEARTDAPATAAEDRAPVDEE